MVNVMGDSMNMEMVIQYKATPPQDISYPNNALDISEIID
jgi:hypothetical protein